MLARMVGTMGKYDPDMGGVEIGPRGGPGDPAIFWASHEACLLALLCFALLCFRFSLFGGRADLGGGIAC